MKNFILTTLSLWFLNGHNHTDDSRGTPSRVLSYLNVTNQFVEDDIVLNGYHYVSTVLKPYEDPPFGVEQTFDHDTSSHATIHFHDSKVTVSCLSIMEEDSSKLSEAARDLARAFDLHQSSLTTAPDPTSSYACTVLSPERHMAWIYADLAGITPIFFALPTSFSQTNRKEAIITSDFLFGYQLGFDDLTAVSPGQIVGIDLNTQNVHFIHRSPSKYDRFGNAPKEKVTIEEIIDMTFESAQASVNKHVSDNTSWNDQHIIVAEVDEMFWTSKLLDCLLDRRQVERLVRNTPPLVLDPQFDVLPSRLKHLSYFFPTHVNDIMLKRRKVSFRQRALDRWNYCHNPYGAGYKRIFYSYFSGLEFRVKEIYLQNLFCSLHGVRIVYPFSALPMQELIHGANTKAWGLINMAIERLIKRGTCYNTGIVTRQIEDKDFSCELTFHCFHRLMFYNGNMRVELTNMTEVSSILEYNHIASGSSHTSDPRGSRRDKTLEKLKELANLHATNDNHIVLLLATSGYYSLLHNFFCYVENIPRSSYFLPLIIVTSDEEVEQLAHSFRAGVFNTQNVYDITQLYLQTAEFGTLRYQQLMLARTEIAMELLLLGFSPVVADIDTVWLQNPLSDLSSNAKLSPELESTLSSSPIRAVVRVNHSSPYDVAITDDDGEVCGCFVAINPTSRGLLFWKEVLNAHRNLVKNAMSKDSKLRRFTDSEQKLLTSFIYGHRYKENLRYRLLSNISFPSGRVFFNNPWLLQGNKSNSGGIDAIDISPVKIVHNNFVIGLENKIFRFEKRRLWMYRPPYSLPSSSSGDRYFGKHFCISPSKYDKWSDFFSFPEISKSVSFNSGYLGVDIITPVHNTILLENKTQVIMAVVEAPTSEFSINEKFASSVNIDPPTHVEFQDVFLGEKSAKKTEVVGYLYKMLSSPHIQVSADLAIRRQHFMIDFDGQLEPNTVAENTLAFATNGYSKPTQSTNSKDMPASSLDFSGSRIFRSPFHSSLEAVALEESMPNISYTVKVLAFKRPESLQRLLNSLSKVDFHYYNFDPVRLGRVAIEFLIDANRTHKESSLVEQTVSVAEAFNWTWGSKKITRRKHNYGTLNQWLHSWKPADDNEIAIILEDDLELSPQYFQWVRRAVDKYYRFDPKHRNMQRLVMETVTNRIATYQHSIRSKMNNSDSTKQNVKYFSEQYRNSKLKEFYDFKDFLQRYAGQPIMFGLCLQRQNLDPVRPNGNFNKKTGHRPFLYSLVGSWGPVFFPRIWHAFREWMIWRSVTDEDFVPLLRDTVVTNYFFKNNPDIWTPFFIKFSSTFGLKCLYPNIPGNFTFVNNFREAGENYATTMGAYATLLDSNILFVIDNSSSERTDVFENSRFSIQVRDMRWSMHHLPSLETLSRWQYDLNGRRLGVLGSASSFAFTVFSPHFVKGSLLSNIANSVLLWTEKFKQDIVPLYLNYSFSSRGIPLLSTDHWVEVVGLIEGTLHPGSTILHFEANPLQWLLNFVLVDEEYNHVIVTKHKSVANKLTSMSEQFVSTERISEVILANESLHLSPFEDVKCIVLYLELNQPMFMHQLLRSIHLIDPIEYILVIDECTSAPYFIQLPFSVLNETSDTFEPLMVEYVAMHQLCDVMPIERGAVLYRKKSVIEALSPQLLKFRNTTSRRLTQSLFERSVVV